MNLKARHLLIILLGGITGAGLGWMASFVFKAGVLPDIEDVLGLQGAGLVFGAIAGMAFAVIAIVARAARDPNAGPARNWTQINGMGSAFIGRSGQREDGSYVTTEWFTILWIPIFPVCRYRLLEHQDARRLFHREYTILDKFPPRGADAARVYGFAVIALLLLIGLAYLVFR